MDCVCRLSGLGAHRRARRLFAMVHGACLQAKTLFPGRQQLRAHNDLYKSLKKLSVKRKRVSLNAKMLIFLRYQVRQLKSNKCGTILKKKKNIHKSLNNRLQHKLYFTFSLLFPV